MIDPSRLSLSLSVTKHQALCCWSLELYLVHKAGHLILLYFICTMNVSCNAASCPALAFQSWTPLRRNQPNWLGVTAASNLNSSQPKHISLTSMLYWPRTGLDCRVPAPSRISTYFPLGKPSDFWPFLQPIFCLAKSCIAKAVCGRLQSSPLQACSGDFCGFLKLAWCVKRTKVAPPWKLVL